MELTTQPTENQIKKMFQAYVRANNVMDFSTANVMSKLSIVQKIPRDKVKERRIGNKMVKYLSYQYAQKALNFIFNFRISNRVVSSEYLTYKEKSTTYEYNEELKKKVAKVEEKDVIEAEVLMEYTFTYPDGTKETRTVSTSHKLYKNPAVTRAMARQAAISKSWSAVAGTFGIGNDLEEKEVTNLDIKYQEAIQVDVVEEKQSIPSFSY